MATAKVLSNLNHDGKAYEVGQTVELDDTAFAQLVEAGVVRAEDTPAAKPVEAAKTETESKPVNTAKPVEAADKPKASKTDKKS